MTSNLTPAELDEIEAVAKEASSVYGRGWHSEVSLERDTRGRIPAWHRDAKFIATMDPATTLALITEVREMRAKVGRVREVHRRTPIYEMCVENGCENVHCFETAVGEYAHDDDLVGYVCYECSDLSDDEPVYWPCDTIKALGEEA